MNRIQKIRRLGILAVLAGILVAFYPAIGFCASPALKSNKIENDVGKQQLVWPLPPEKPRIRFLQQIHGVSDIAAPRKSSMLERLAGVKKGDFRPYFVKPYGISTDSQGRIYVTDNGQATVFVLDRERHAVSYIGLDGQPRLQQPMGITVDAKDRVWLADAGAQRVYAFDSQLKLRAVLGKKGELMNPVGVATDLSRNRLYVADSKQHCIVVYDTETGLMAGKFGKRGFGDGEFNFPTDLTVSNDGRIYVADTMNRRIQVFDPQYKLVDKFGAEGVAWGQFHKPKSVALDRYQNIYVVDADFCNFQIFDQKKRLLMFLGEFGDAPGQFAVPKQIHIDANNFLYVVDQSNGRIQILRLLDGNTEEPAPAGAAIAGQ